MGQLTAWFVRAIVGRIARWLILLRELEVEFSTAKERKSKVAIAICLWLFAGLMTHITELLAFSIALISITIFLLSFAIVSPVLDGLVVLLLLPISFLAYLPFGATHYMAVCFRCPSKQHLRATWSITTIEGDPDAPLSHSLLYDSSDSFACILAWLRSRKNSYQNSVS
jgi:hypothetical protein